MKKKNKEKRNFFINMPTECSNLLNSFAIERDINESKSVDFIENKQDGFVLHESNAFRSCVQLSDPFNTFCMVPDPFSILTEDMCKLSNQTDDPNSLFERLVRGEITHPDDLPSIWESANLPQPLPQNEDWMTVRDFTNQARIPINNNNDYLGLSYIATNAIADIAVGNDCVCLYVMMRGILQEAQLDGILRPVKLYENDNSEDPELIQGNNDAAQSIQVNSTGRIRVAMFSNSLYMYINGKWIKITDETIQTYFKSVIWETPNGEVYVAVAVRYSNARKFDVLIYKFKNSNANTIGEGGLITPLFVHSIETPSNTVAVFGFLCVTLLPDTTNNWVIMWSTAAATSEAMHSSGLSVHFLQLSDAGEFSAVEYNKWNILDPRVLNISSIILTGATRSCSVTNTRIIDGIIYPYVKASMFNTLTMTFAFPFNSPFYSITEYHSFPMVLNQSIDRSVTMFVQNSTLHTSILDNNQAITLANQFSLTFNAQEPLFMFGIAPNGIDVWIFRQGILHRLTNNNDKTLGIEWTSQFNLYSPAYAKCSDLGLPDLDPSIYNPGDSMWYLGLKISAKTITLKQDECVRSPHDLFRFIIKKTSKTSSDDKVAFSHIETFSLQRANEYALCHSGIVKLYDDSNVKIFENSDTILWDSHTHDRVNNLNLDAAEFVVRLAPNAVSSPNGLYLLYMTKKNRLRLVFNAFNALRFTRWCSRSPELLGKAIDMQSNFCWNALKNPDPTSTAFADSRCTCIGGERLFLQIAPNASAIPTSVIAPLQENLPCLAQGCNPGLTVLDTNVGIYWAQRCANRAFVFCDTSLKIGANSKLENGGIIQNTICGVNQDFCSDKNPCGPGLTCSNGKCLTACSNDEQCAQAHGESLIHRCVSGVCQPSLRPAQALQLPLIAIFAIIAAIVLLILILLFVGLLTKKLLQQQKMKNKLVTK